MVINVSLFRDKFLQIRKYIEAPGEYGIELAFPRVKWSEPYWGQIRRFCEREKLEYRIEREDPAIDIDFLYVDFGQNSAEATARVRQLMKELFGVTEEQLIWCHSSGLSPEDVLVDRMT